MKRILAILALMAACGSSEGRGSSTARRVCADFSCQGQAQSWHNAHPGDGLDGDGDGVACESLPRCVLVERACYIGALTDQPGRFDILLDRLQIDDDQATAPQFRGIVHWGLAGDQSGRIVGGEMLHGIAMLQVLPGAMQVTSPCNSQYGSFAVLLDITTGQGTIVGADPTKMLGLPALSGFASIPGGWANTLSDQ